MSFKLSWEPHGVYVKFDGKLSGEVLASAVMRIHGDERFDRLRYSINDFLDCDEVSVAAATMEFLSALDAEGALSNPHITIIVIARSPEAIQLVEAYRASGVSRYATVIFPSVAAAREWLTGKLSSVVTRT